MISVYIASPYTLGDTALNVRRQINVSDTLMDYGYCPVAPLLTHFHHIVYQRNYEDWMKINFKKIEMCDVLLRLEGDSCGADREVEFAKSIGKSIYYSTGELLAKTHEAKNGR